jgi:hypothetical protein
MDYKTKETAMKDISIYVIEVENKGYLNRDKESL